MPTTRQSSSVPCRTKIGIDGFIKTSFALLTMMVRSAPNGRVRIRFRQPGYKEPGSQNSNPSRPAFLDTGTRSPASIESRSDNAHIHNFRQQRTFSPASRLTEKHETEYSRTLFRAHTTQPHDPNGFQGKTFREMVEPDGIEPTTSCLQSTRSPN